MKLRRLLLPAIAAAPLCLFPGFARQWAQHISLPILKLLETIGKRIPFSLLEWGIVLLAATLVLSFIVGIFRRGLLRSLLHLLRRLIALIILFVLVFLLIWFPLYHTGSKSIYTASPAQLTAACEVLIGQINASEMDFSNIPKDLPAKTAAFPAWMRALGVSGIFSFPTGEALISPDLPACAVPFVAVHESMHARGYAEEGAANIAAWEDCMQRGGVYAQSARLWALRYCMAALQTQDSQAYLTLQAQMTPNTRMHYRAVGGGREILPHSAIVRAAFSALGISEETGNYEILSAYLASRMPE